MIGTTYMLPINVEWSDGDDYAVDLWITDFGTEVSVMATCLDNGAFECVFICTDAFEFSRMFVNYVQAAIESVTDEGDKWKTQRVVVAEVVH